MIDKELQISRVNIGQLLCAAALIMVFGIAVGEVHSFDIFWQLQSGKYLWQTQSFLYKDTFSLASEVYRYEHCWLHDMVFYLSHVLGGYAGISLLKGFLVAALLFCSMLVSRLRNVGWAAIFLTSPAMVLLTFWAWKERPQLWSFLGLLLLMLAFERIRLHKRAVGLAFIVLLCWSNLHAGYVLAFPILLAYLVGELIDYKRKSPWALSGQGYGRLCLTALAVPIAAVITPYGLLPFKTLFVVPKFGEASGAITQAYNVDWRGTSFAGYPDYYYAMSLVAVVLLLNWRRLRMADAFLLGGLAYMGTTLERHTPFFLLASAALLPCYVETLLEWLTRKLSRIKPQVIIALMLVVGCGVTLHWAKPPLKNYGFFNPGIREWHYPVKEADFVLEHKIPGNLFNAFGAGGYLMWRLYPEYKVFWDGRQDSTEMYRKGLVISAGGEGWQDILNDYDVNILILEACSQVDGSRFPLLEKLRRNPAWVLSAAGETHLVFVRKASMPAEWIDENTLPTSRIDDTILSEAKLLLQVTPLRRQALWEAAQILLKRRDYEGGYLYLRRYIQVLGPENVSPSVLNYYRQLSARFSQ